MRRLRHLATATALAGILSVLSAVGAAQADEPAGGCPSDKWEPSVFPLNWQPGDPTDPTGDNLLLQTGNAGTIEEFGSLEAGLAAFGFATFDEFYAAVVDPQYNTQDRNDDGVLCVKRFPSQGNQAAYLANIIDNRAQSNIR